MTILSLALVILPYNLLHFILFLATDIRIFSFAVAGQSTPFSLIVNFG
jgi:hypothetical protein